MQAERLPVMERTRLQPASPYAVSKVAQGYLARQYVLSHGLPVVCTRTFPTPAPGAARASRRAPSRGRSRRSRPGAAARPRRGEPRRRARLHGRAGRGARLLAAAGAGRAGRSTTSAAAAGSIGDILQELIEVAGAQVEVRVDPERLRPSDIPALVGDPASCATRRAGSRRSRCGARSATCSRTGGDTRRPPPPAAPPAALKVLLTGGTGFLGKNVARALHAAGHELRVLARAGSDLAGLPAGVEVVRGDVTDAAAMRRAAEGCRAVLHMAALVKMWVRTATVRRGERGRPAQRARRRGVGGRAAGLHVVVHRRGPRGAGARRRVAAHPGGGFRNDYERTKAQADALAREAAAGGADVVILYPGVVYGPGDLTDGNLVVKMVADHLAGRFPGSSAPGTGCGRTRLSRTSPPGTWPRWSGPPRAAGTSWPARTRR